MVKYNVEIVKTENGNATAAATTKMGNGNEQTDMNEEENGTTGKEMLIQLCN